MATGLRKSKSIYTDSTRAADGSWSPTMGDRSFDLPTVKMATRDFSQSHVIGEGGFAVVYKVLHV